MAFTYGSRKYGEGVYGGGDTPFISSFSAATVEVYDNTLARKGTFQLGAGGFIDCQFTHTEKGCAGFSLRFSSFVNIGKKDIIKIKVFDSDFYFFTGVVREEPIQGATKTDYTYSGFGFNDYLVRINAESLSYANKTIQFILDDLLDNNITVKTPIGKNAAKINPPNITLTSFDSNYAQMNDVIDALLKVANSSGFYIAGVDREGDFFFLPRSDETQATLVTGASGRYGIDEYNPEDSIESRTKYFLLDKDGVYIDAITSAEANDIYEEKLTAPDLDNTTAENWAEGELAESERITRSANIIWQVWPHSPAVIIADGNIRIISNILPEDATPPGEDLFGGGLFGGGLFGGAQYQGFNLDDTLRIVQVDYVLTGNEVVRNIQLGSRFQQLDETIIKIKKDLTDLRVSLGR